MPDALIQKVFAGYRIDSRVGRGGMGVVYRATDLTLDRAVALKVLTEDLADDEGFRRRFVTESKLAASLDHPNVLPIHAAGEHEGVLYIAMRLVPGADLRETLRQDGPLEPERAARIVAQVASALDAAHAHGLVHRDVKPANVLVTPEGHAYLTDFGLTKQLSRDCGGDPDRDGAGDAGLRRARADPRRGDRAVHRRLLARLHAHAPADRRGAVHGADRGGEAVGALLRAAAEAERARARARHAGSTRSSRGR